MPDKKVKTIQVWTNSSIEKEADSYDYDAIIEDGITKLLISNAMHSSNPGDELAELYDHGNGLILTIDEQEIELAYHEALQILILLLINNDGKVEFRKSKTILSI